MAPAGRPAAAGRIEHMDMPYMDKRSPLVSIVVPCFNEEETIAETHRRLDALATERPGERFEFLFVNDGSRDRTLELLRGIAASDRRVRVVSFARNFGHQLAVTAGIDHARGDAVVLIDADLQDPPEVVKEMIDRWKDGYAVVYGVRTDRPGRTRAERSLISRTKVRADPLRNYGNPQEYPLLARLSLAYILVCKF